VFLEQGLLVLLPVVLQVLQTHVAQDPPDVRHLIRVTGKIGRRIVAFADPSLCFLHQLGGHEQLP
jgi:hypothetical protein